MLTILWPESDGERARHALSQTIYSLRGDLGIEVVLSTPDLRLDAQRISSDVEEFRSAVGGKRWTEAAALYVGPFLEGFYLADAAQFERWADSERTALATDGVRAIEYLAKESARLGRLNDAVEHWRQLTRLDPVSSRFAAAYMEALAAQGDRVGALAHGKTYANLLRQEFDAEPDGAVQRLVSHLREHAPRDDTSPHDPGERLVPAPASIPPRETATPRVQPTEKVRVEPNEKVGAAPSGGRRSFTLAAHQGPRVRLKPVLTAAAIVAMAIAVVLGLRSPTAARMPARPVLAVGRIRDLVTPDSASLSDAMSEMLATSLGRLDDLQVIANSRMLELTPRDADTSRTALTDAARRAGATEIIEGELIPLPDRLLRLEIRRVDLARGLVRGGYRVSGSDRIALFDSVTSLVAADLRVGAPTTSLADASTRSPIAYRFYEEGLRAFYQFDTYAASRLFHSAIREDSMFAMATYYAWRAAVATGDACAGLAGSKVRTRAAVPCG